MKAGWEYRCPAPARQYPGGPEHWGVACWDDGSGNCGGVSYIEVNVGRIGPSDRRLRYVVAHETCHVYQLEATHMTTEQDADACAAAHGFPRV